jgi:hypothetical protein
MHCQIMVLDHGNIKTVWISGEDRPSAPTSAGWWIPLAAAEQQRFERLGVEQRSWVHRATVEQGGRSPLWILLLERSVHGNHPGLVPPSADAVDKLRAGQSDPRAQVGQVGDGEAAALLGRLMSEQFSVQVVETPFFGRQGQGVVRPHRFNAKEASHPVLHSHCSGSRLAAQQVSAGFLELTAVGALGVLEQHELSRRSLVADHDSAFCGVKRRNRCRRERGHAIGLSQAGVR